MRGLFGLEGILTVFGILTAFVITAASCCQTIRHTTVFPSAQSSQKYHYSVAMAVTTPGPRGDIGKQATAWAIDGDHLLTAGHFCESVQDGVMSKKASPIIHLMQSGLDGVPIDVIDAIILAKSDEHDICILISPDHPFLPIVISDNYNLVETEDPIIVVGAPKGIFPVRREGTVAEKKAYQYKAFKDMMLLAILIEGGSSGSPVIWGGEVIGMVVMRPYRLHESALAVPAPQLIEFIDEHIN